MRRGLVIGKFMPLHAGHVALIRFASQQCDELIVSMSYTQADPIAYQRRLEWLKSTFKDDPKILPKLIADDFDQPALPLVERTKQWAGVISKVYPKVDVVVSSEDYGQPFADALGALHVQFDQERKIFPISASMIRQKPFTHWQFIPEFVRPFFVKKVCFYGAESTGKSTMAIKMAEKYQTVFVPEVAREMLTRNEFTLDDIIAIGHAHYNRIKEAETKANKIIFCDTDAITTEIYSKHYLNVIPPQLFDLEKRMPYDQYFLFHPDVPWVADGLRDLGDQRQTMHYVFKNALIERNIQFIDVQGTWKERERIVAEQIDKMLSDT